MEQVLKTCRKCMKGFPATLEFFYKNSGGKYGLTPRCKKCVGEDNLESQKKRDPAIVRAQANARSKKHYHANIELGRERARVSAKKARDDPQKKLRVQARKRANGAGGSSPRRQSDGIGRHRLLIESRGSQRLPCGFESRLNA